MGIKIDIEEIKTIKIRRDERLVVKVPPETSTLQIKQARYVLDQHFKNKYLLYKGDMEFTKIKIKDIKE